MTAEEELRSKLELIRESVTATKFITEALISRVSRIELELRDSDERIDLLNDKSIRSDETMKTILNSMSNMSTDIRSVRNSVLSAIFGAAIVWAVGTAFATMYNHDASSQIHKSPPTIGKNA